MERSTGQLGETIVAQYLSRCGYTVVDRNVRWPWGEIDIVAKAGERHVFVEVKTHQVTHGGDDEADGSMRAEERVDERKLQRLRNAVEMYWQTHVRDQSEIRFAVAVVLLNDETRAARIRWIDEPL